MPTRYNPLVKHLRTFEEAMRDVLANDNIDERLTPGQQHKLVTMIWGEPVVKLSVLMRLHEDPKSKVALSPELYVATAKLVHQMLYPPLTPKDKKEKAIEEFQMSFAWMTDAPKEAAE